MGQRYLPTDQKVGGSNPSERAGLDWMSLNRDYSDWAIHWQIARCQLWANLPPLRRLMGARQHRGGISMSVGPVPQDWFPGS
jgi:hypothetical protein